MLKKFAPRQFFETAAFLQEKAGVGDDGYLRSSISRYYYAAFICARDQVNISSFGMSGHKKVADFFSERASQDSEEGLVYKTVGDNLAALKRLREKADYESNAICQTKECTKSRKLSEQVLEALANIQK